jgi:hypothetical protein
MKCSIATEPLFDYAPSENLMRSPTSKAGFYIESFAREIGWVKSALIDNSFSSIDHSIDLDGCIASASVSFDSERKQASIIIFFPFIYEKERAGDLVNACNYINRWGSIGKFVFNRERIRRDAVNYNFNIFFGPIVDQETEVRALLSAAYRRTIDDCVKYQPVFRELADSEEPLETILASHEFYFPGITVLKI